MRSFDDYTFVYEKIQSVMSSLDTLLKEYTERIPTDGKTHDQIRDFTLEMLDKVDHFSYQVHKLLRVTKSLLREVKTNQVVGLPSPRLVEKKLEDDFSTLRSMEDIARRRHQTLMRYVIINQYKGSIEDGS